MGQALAGSLRDPAARAWLREQVSQSPYVEYRVHLRHVLRGDATARGYFELAGKEDVEWDARLNGLPDLELYFPVGAQRDALGSDMPVEVAVPIESGRYAIFQPDGTVREVNDAYDVPVPTLLLARSEIDYDRPASALRGGANTGSALREAGVRHVGRSALRRAGFPLFFLRPLSSVIDSSYHTRMWAWDVHDDNEPAIRGKAEVEIFGHISSENAACAYFTDVEEGPHSFDVGDPNKTVATAVPEGSETIFLEVWEDDNDACIIHTDDDDIMGWHWQTISQFGQLWGTSLGGSTQGDIDLKVFAYAILQ